MLQDRGLLRGVFLAPIVQRVSTAVAERIASPVLLVSLMRRLLRRAAKIAPLAGDQIPEVRAAMTVLLVPIVLEVLIVRTAPLESLLQLQRSPHVPIVMQGNIQILEQQLAPIVYRGLFQRTLDLRVAKIAR